MKIHKSPEYIYFLNKNIKNLYGIIGSVFYSNKCGKFIVLECIGKIKTNDKYKIKFLYSGKEYITNITNILTGEIKDLYYPTIEGIACLGEYSKELRNIDKILYRKLLERYYSMIKRCYNKKCSSYNNYGKLGVKVSKEWLNFSNFAKDIINNKDFDKNKFISGELVIDKDKKQKNISIENRIYSKETISLINRIENNQYRDNIRMGEKHSKYFIYIHNGIETVEKNIAKFSRDSGIKVKTIRNILYGETSADKYDFNFRYPTEKEIKLIEDGFLYKGKDLD